MVYCSFHGLEIFIDRGGNMDASVAGIDTGEVKFFNKKRSGVKVIYLMCLWL